MGVVVALIIFLILMCLLFFAGVAAFAEAECRAGAICSGVMGVVMLCIIIAAATNKLSNKCPTCGKYIDQATFCSDCGTYLHSNKCWYCETCHKDVPLSQNYCTDCGASQKDWTNAHTELYGPKTKTGITKAKNIAQNNA